jgi:hypothetical protein
LKEKYYIALGLQIQQLRFREASPRSLGEQAALVGFSYFRTLGLIP